MFSVTNLAEVSADIDRWEAQVLELCTKVAKGLMKEALTVAATHSAQYSGDFAANWKVSVNTPDESFVEGIFPGQRWPTQVPYVMGDAPAIQHALDAATGKLDSFKFGDTLWLCNSARHQEHYAWKIENNQVKFRPGNSGSPIDSAVRVIQKDFSEVNARNVGFIT